MFPHGRAIHERLPRTLPRPAVTSRKPTASTRSAVIVEGKETPCSDRCPRS